MKQMKNITIVLFLATIVGCTIEVKMDGDLTGLAGMSDEDIDALVADYLERNGFPPLGGQPVGDQSPAADETPRQNNHGETDELDSSDDELAPATLAEETPEETVDEEENHFTCTEQIKTVYPDEDEDGLGRLYEQGEDHWGYCPDDDDLPAGFVLNSLDNCPEVSSPNHDDLDGDRIGDICDLDADGDGLGEADCNDMDPSVSYAHRFMLFEDVDDDGWGGDESRSYDLCPDESVVGWITTDGDNCPDVSNPLQEDMDYDMVGDACDFCPDNPSITDDAEDEEVLCGAREGNVMMVIECAEAGTCYPIISFIDEVGKHEYLPLSTNVFGVIDYFEVEVASVCERGGVYVSGWSELTDDHMSLEMLAEVQIRIDGEPIFVEPFEYHFSAHIFLSSELFGCEPTDEE